MQPNYRTAPMPAAVARLATTVGGMPVPYVSRWGSDQDTTRYVYRRGQGTMAMCTCKLGIGVPQIGSPCVTRQRRAMVKHLCSICGEQFGLGEEMVFVGGVPQGGLEGYPSGTWTSIEPPTHEGCVVYSAAACPRLRGSYEDIEVAVTTGYSILKKIIVNVLTGEAAALSLTKETPRVMPIMEYIGVPHAKTTRFQSLDRWLHLREQ